MQGPDVEGDDLVARDVEGGFAGWTSAEGERGGGEADAGASEEGGFDAKDWEFVSSHTLVWGGGDDYLR